MRTLKGLTALLLLALLIYGGCLREDDVANFDYMMPPTVAELQQYLNDSFGADLTVDGKFGPATYRALQRFYELKECDQYAIKEFEK